MTPPTAANACLNEPDDYAQSRGSLNQALCQVIFQHPQETERFSRIAETLGVDPTAPRIALALALKTQIGPTSAGRGSADRITLAASRYFGHAHDALIRTIHRGRLVVWVPCLLGETIIAGECRIQKPAALLVKSVPDILAMGVGLLNQGATGWALSAEEALKALDCGLQGTPQSRLRLFSDIAIHESVRHKDHVLRYLNALLERLAERPELLTTLQAYFELRQRRKVTANVLRIHPNTLNYRLERIEQLLGARLDDAGWIAKLHTAVRLRQAGTGDMGFGSGTDTRRTPRAVD